MKISNLIVKILLQNLLKKNYKKLKIKNYKTYCLFKRHGRWRSDNANDGYLADQRLSVSKSIGLYPFVLGIGTYFGSQFFITDIVINTGPSS